MRTNREETTPGLLLINATTVERSSSKTFLICLEKCPKIYKVDVFIVATIIYFVNCVVRIYVTKGFPVITFGSGLKYLRNIILLNDRIFRSYLLG